MKYFINKKHIRAYIDENTERQDISHRGGGWEVNLNSILEAFDISADDARGSVYQNYLGGGLLGSIGWNVNGEAKEAMQASEEVKTAIDALGAELAKYYFEVQNGGEEYELYEDGPVIDFEKQQTMPASGY